MRYRVGNDLTLGHVVNTGQRLALPAESRDKHLYVCGGTGVGKSKFLEHLIRQDILAQRASKCGMLVIDPHGSLYDSLMRWLAFRGIDRPIIPIDLRSTDWVVSYNVLRQRAVASPAVIADNLVDAIAYIFGVSGTNETPLFARWAVNLLLALYENKLTLADALHLLSGEAGVRHALTASLKDQLSQRDWRRANSLKPKDFELEIGSTINRLHRFIRNENLRLIFGQPDVSLDLGQALDEGSIILVSLARQGARISKENANLFGTLLLADLWTAAQERGKSKQPKPFYLYLDEFQRFITPTIAENLDEARGFGIHVTVAQQFPNQLLNSGPHGRQIYDSIMENASSKIVFRMTHEENLRPLAMWLFRSVMNPDDIKHELFSTRVVKYVEEYRKAYGFGTTTSTGGTEHTSESEGKADGGSESEGGSNSRATESWNAYFASTYGTTDSWSQSRTENQSIHPVLIPILGKELSHVQFRSLDEQLFRAMAVLFDQKERQCVARLVGMRAPASLFTPTVEEIHIRTDRVCQYVDRLLNRLPFARKMNDALARFQARQNTFAHDIIDANCPEPSKASRRIS